MSESEHAADRAPRHSVKGSVPENILAVDKLVGWVQG
jgi:hypothetical protein